MRFTWFYRTDDIAHLRIFAGIAVDYQISFTGKNGVSLRFKTKPTIKIEDYTIMFQLSRWNKGKPISIDVLYFMCKQVDGTFVPATHVIGVPAASFECLRPKMVFYRILQATKKEDADTMAAQSYASANKSVLDDDNTSTTAAHQHKEA